MKFHTLLLALAGCFISKSQETGQPGSYTPIKWDPSNPQLFGSLNFGLPEAISQMVADGELDVNDGEWGLSEVNSVQSQVVDGINYRFVV